MQKNLIYMLLLRKKIVNNEQDIERKRLILNYLGYNRKDCKNKDEKK